MLYHTSLLEALQGHLFLLNQNNRAFIRGEPGSAEGVCRTHSSHTHTLGRVHIPASRVITWKDLFRTVTQTRAQKHLQQEPGCADVMSLPGPETFLFDERIRRREFFFTFFLTTSHRGTRVRGFKTQPAKIHRDPEFCVLRVPTGGHIVNSHEQTASKFHFNAK